MTPSSLLVPPLPNRFEEVDFFFLSFFPFWHLFVRFFQRGELSAPCIPRTSSLHVFFSKLSDVVVCIGCPYALASPAKTPTHVAPSSSSSSSSSFGGGGRGDPVRLLAFIKLLAALHEHHSRPKELIIRYDLPGRLRSLCTVAGGSLSSSGAATRTSNGGGLDGQTVREAAAASAVQEAAEKLLSGMRLNKIT